MLVDRLGHFLFHLPFQPEDIVSALQEEHEQRGVSVRTALLGLAVFRHTELPVEGHALTMVVVESAGDYVQTLHLLGAEERTLGFHGCLGGSGSLLFDGCLERNGSLRVCGCLMLPGFHTQPSTFFTISRIASASSFSTAMDFTSYSMLTYARSALSSIRAFIIGRLPL